jgi:hypothetical protein
VYCCALIAKVQLMVRNKRELEFPLPNVVAKRAHLAPKTGEQKRAQESKLVRRLYVRRYTRVGQEKSDTTWNSQLPVVEIRL